MLTETLLTIALRLPGVAHDAGAQARARATIDAISIVTRDETERRIALVWSFRESSWWTRAVGDGGHSFGLCQNSHAEIRDARSTLHVVMRSRLEAMRVCVDTMRLARARCGGSLEAGLGLVASGKCGGASYLVRRRCRDAGVTC